MLSISRPHMLRSWTVPLASLQIPPIRCTSRTLHETHRAPPTPIRRSPDESTIPRRGGTIRLVLTTPSGDTNPKPYNSKNLDLRAPREQTKLGRNTARHLDLGTPSERHETSSIIGGKTWQQLSAIAPADVQHSATGVAAACVPTTTQQFLERAEKGEAGVPEATVLLWNSQEKLKVLQQEEKQREAAAVGASLILRWLLGTDPKQWDIIITPAFAAGLCWHLEAEGRSDAVRSWYDIWCKDQSLRTNAVMAPFTPEDPIFIARYFRWPALMLSAMCDAKVQWSTNRCVDSALEYLFSFMDLTHNQVWPCHALITLYRPLIKDWTSACSPALFDRFLTLYRWEMTGVQAQLSKAIMSLVHPRMPSAHNMVRFCQDPEHMKKVLHWSLARRRRVATWMLRAAWMMCHQGDSSAALFLGHSSFNLDFAPWGAREKLLESWQCDVTFKALHPPSHTLHVLWSKLEAELSTRTT